MKRGVLLLILIAVASCLSGCVIISCEESSRLADTALIHAQTVDQIKETVTHF